MPSKYTKDELQERSRLKAKRYYQLNRAKVLRYQKRYAEINREKIAKWNRTYQRENAKKLASKRHAYYLANKKTHQIRSAKWRKQNRERSRAWQNSWRAKNKNRLAYLRRKNRVLIRKRMAKWWKKNARTINSRRRKYFLEHRDHMRVMKRRWEALNPTKILEYRKRSYKKCYAKNKIKQLEYCRRRRAKMRNVLLEIDRSAYRRRLQYLRTRSGLRCRWCRSVVPLHLREIDHIIPIARGGGDLISNLCLSCRKCNRTKHAKLPEEFAAILKKSFSGKNAPQS